MVLGAWAWLVVRFGPRPGEPGRPWIVLLGGLLAFAVLGPALQPWYFTWVAPFVALALPSLRWQRVWLSATIVIVVTSSAQVSFGLPVLVLVTWWLWHHIDGRSVDVLAGRPGYDVSATTD
jgi:hypothetical protein